jgi:hypothetical protein
MSGKIYLLQENGSLQAMSERSYVTEERLQALLGDYPDLLAGDQMDEENPRRWLLISREIGVPIEERGGDWMSLDHLFLDQDAIPTLVEVKRSSDTRIRREVVGQMLDYASNAVAYWSVDRLRVQFEAGCKDNGTDPIQLIAELIESDPTDESAMDDFWERVDTNLHAGKIRLVFAADEIPPELRRIVEFLNATMDPVEVLAVEIRQYAGEGLKTLVPQVIGQTTQARGRKFGGGPEKRQWDEPSFLQELDRRRGEAETTVARRILEWAKTNMPSIWWGQGTRSGGFIPGLDHNGTWHQVVEVWTYGSVEVQFQHMRSRPPFDDEARRSELLRRLNEIPDIALPEDSITRRPSIPLSALQDEPVLEQFLAVLDWVVQEIKTT